MENKSLRKIRIQTLDKTCYDFEISAEMNIRDFKKLIEERTSFSADSQNLIFQGQKFADEQTLDKYITSDNQIVFLLGGTKVSSGEKNTSNTKTQIKSDSSTSTKPSNISNPLSSLLGNLTQNQSGTSDKPLNKTSNEQSLAEHSNSSQQSQKMIALPSKHLQNIASIINSLTGENSSFPGPGMPQLNIQRNSLTLLGAYLHNYQFQLMRLIPFLSRLGDLLQRESLIVNSEERAQVQTLANKIGDCLDEVVESTAPVVSLFKGMEIGENPGDFKLYDRIHRPIQTQNQPTTHNVTNQTQIKVPSSGPNTYQSNLQIETKEPAEQTIYDLISSNGKIVSEEEEFIISIVGTLKIADLVSLFSGNDLSPLDKNHSKIKANIENLIKKYNKKDALIEKSAEFISRIFYVEDPNGEMILEGFEPHTVALEGAPKHIEKLIDISIHDYKNSKEKYSQELVKALSSFTKDLVSDVSEGFIEEMAGLNDFLREKFEKYVIRVAGQEKAMLSGIVWPKIWEKVKIAMQSASESKQNSIEDEEKFILEIKNNLDSQPKSERSMFSESYLRGDLNYQEK